MRNMENTRTVEVPYADLVEGADAEVLIYIHDLGRYVRLYVSAVSHFKRVAFTISTDPANG